MWSHQLGLYLGVYEGLLRFFTRDGQLVPTPEQKAEQLQQLAEQAEQKAEQLQQLAEQAEQKAEQSQQLAEQAEQKAERLAAKLRELNIDLDTI